MQRGCLHVVRVSRHIFPLLSSGRLLSSSTPASVNWKLPRYPPSYQDPGFDPLFLDGVPPRDGISPPSIGTSDEPCRIHSKSPNYNIGEGDPRFKPKQEHEGDSRWTAASAARSTQFQADILGQVTSGKEAGWLEGGRRGCASLPLQADVDKEEEGSGAQDVVGVEEGHNDEASLHIPFVGKEASVFSGGSSCSADSAEEGGGLEQVTQGRVDGASIVSGHTQGSTQRDDSPEDRQGPTQARGTSTETATSSEIHSSGRRRRGRRREGGEDGKDQWTAAEDWSHRNQLYVQSIVGCIDRVKHHLALYPPERKTVTRADVAEHLQREWVGVIKVAAPGAMHPGDQSQQGVSPGGGLSHVVTPVKTEKATRVRRRGVWGQNPSLPGRVRLKPVHITGALGHCEGDSLLSRGLVLWAMTHQQVHPPLPLLSALIGSLGRGRDREGVLEVADEIRAVASKSAPDGSQQGTHKASQVRGVRLGEGESRPPAVPGTENIQGEGRGRWAEEGRGETMSGGSGEKGDSDGLRGEEGEPVGKGVAYLDDIARSALAGALQVVGFGRKALAVLERRHGWEGEIGLLSYCKLMHFHNKKECFRRTLRVYEEMKRSGCEVDEGLHRHAITAFNGLGMRKEIFHLFREIKRKGIPEVWTCNEVLQCHNKQNEFLQAEHLFQRMKKWGGSSSPNQYSYSIMINIRGKQSRFEEAEALFTEFNALGRHPDDAIWTCLIQMYACKGHLAKAKEWLRIMLKSGAPLTQSSGNALLQGYADKGKIEEASRLADLLESRGMTPLVTVQKRRELVRLPWKECGLVRRQRQK